MLRSSATQINREMMLEKGRECCTFSIIKQILSDLLYAPDLYRIFCFATSSKSFFQKDCLRCARCSSDQCRKWEVFPCASQCPALTPHRSFGTNDETHTTSQPNRHFDQWASLACRVVPAINLSFTPFSSINHHYSLKTAAQEIIAYSPKPPINCNLRKMA